MSRPIMTMTDNEIAPLSIDRDESTDAEEENPTSLDVRLLRLVKNAPNRTIRAALVSAELGISVNDASAELCGLLAAVGGGEDGASFKFENKDGQHVMVFSFPPDFEQRALRKQRSHNRKEMLRNLLKVGVKLLKTITAFGLILSLFIVAIAAVAAMIAAIVAMSNQQGNHRQRNSLMLQLRALFITLREMLWCYAVFGPSDTERNGQDPFLREVAYDASLVLSVCCGNPGSIFYWMRANQLSRRSRRHGWVHGQRTMESDIPGVTLVRQRDWQSDDAPPEIEPHRGLLSTAVEYLFGPSEDATCSSVETGYWRLRAAVLIEMCNENSQSGISLVQICPFVDDPPSSLHDSATIIDQGLRVMSYFNGVPKNNNSENCDMMHARFVFPELLSESSAVTRYQESADLDDGTWSSFLCKTSSNNERESSSTELPTFLKERRWHFTTLTFQQLTHCVVLGVLNLIGVVCFHQSISKGGVLEIPSKHPLEWFLKTKLVPTLQFYAILFFALPLGRLLILFYLNKRVGTRNERRKNLSSELLNPVT